MQPLIQAILSQITDSWKVQLFLFFCQLAIILVITTYWIGECHGFQCHSLKIIQLGSAKIFNSESLCFWSRIGIRVKISHYIQPSNLLQVVKGLSIFFKAIVKLMDSLLAYQNRFLQIARQFYLVGSLKLCELNFQRLIVGPQVGLKIWEGGGTYSWISSCAENQLKK